MSRRCRRGVVPGAVASLLVVTLSCAQEADPDEMDLLPDDAAEPIAFETHWHAAYGVYVCGEFLPPEPEFETAVGIHTHGDGVIHIHPFNDDAAGTNATLGVFLRDSVVELDDGELTVDGERYVDGDECDGEPATVQVAYWEDAGGAGDPEIVTDHAERLRFRHDGEAFTIAFVPEGADIPLPPTADRLGDLGVADPAGSPGDHTGGTSVDPPGMPDEDPTEYSDPELAAEVLSRTPPEPAPPPADTPADTLEIETLIDGQGEAATVGDQVTVHYVGVLADGTVVDASWDRGEPFPVTLGQGLVIAGWEQGLIGAQIGERRRLLLGAGNAYGSEGTPDGAIPPNAPMAFVIDVIDITR